MTFRDFFEYTDWKKPYHIHFIKGSLAYNHYGPSVYGKFIVSPSAARTYQTATEFVPVQVDAVRRQELNKHLSSEQFKRLMDHGFSFLNMDCQKTFYPDVLHYTPEL